MHPDCKSTIAGHLNCGRANARRQLKGQALSEVVGPGPNSVGLPLPHLSDVRQPTGVRRPIIHHDHTTTEVGAVPRTQPPSPDASARVAADCQ